MRNSFLDKYYSILAPFSFSLTQGSVRIKCTYNNDLKREERNLDYERLGQQRISKCHTSHRVVRYIHYTMRHSPRLQQ